jgi:hypothetical protein
MTAAACTPPYGLLSNLPPVYVQILIHEKKTPVGVAVVKTNTLFAWLVPQALGHWINIMGLSTVNLANILSCLFALGLRKSQQQA